MKNILTGILSLGLVALLVADSYSQFANSTTRENFQNLDFLTVSFLFVLSLYLFALASKTSSPKSAASESDESASEQKQDSDSSAQLLYFLSVLQEKGRLLDFAMDDIAPYSDEQVGRVARVVHQGVRNVLDETMNIEPVHVGDEGDTISVSSDYNSLSCRLVGNLSAKPPFSGKVLHKGWRAKEISLPISVGAELVKSEVVQPMELEVA